MAERIFDGRRPAIFAAVAALGLIPAWMLAKAIVYSTQDFRPSDVLAADCDDCELTVLLDGIGYLAGTLAAYVVLVGIAFWTLTRSGFLRTRRA